MVGTPGMRCDTSLEVVGSCLDKEAGHIRQEAAEAARCHSSVVVGRKQSSPGVHRMSVAVDSACHARRAHEDVGSMASSGVGAVCAWDLVATADDGMGSLGHTVVAG